MKTSLRALIICSALLLAILPSTAQDVIDLPKISDDVQAIRIAVPQALQRGGADVAVELIEVLREDLAFSGFFEVIDPRMYELANFEGDTPVFEEWAADSGIGAQGVTHLKLDITGSSLTLDAWVWDVSSQSQLLGRRYAGKTQSIRRVAHRLADDILKQYTGADGIAGTLISFVGKHNNSKEVYLMDYDGARVRRLTSSGNISLTPTWSPDGNELAYVSFRGGPPQVWVMSAEGALNSEATVNAVLSTAPEWSPDGRQIFYSADVEGDGNTDLYVLDRASGRNRRLTRNPQIDTSPAVSPNGRELAFTSDRSRSSADLRDGRRRRERPPRDLGRFLQHRPGLVARRGLPRLRHAGRRSIRDPDLEPADRAAVHPAEPAGEQRESALVAGWPPPRLLIRSGGRVRHLHGP